jgi:hypothetical protein
MEKDKTMISRALFNSKMTHRCTIETLGTSGYGKKTVASTQTGVACLFDYQTQTMTKLDGEQVLVNGMCFLKSDASIDAEYRDYQFKQTSPTTRTNMEVFQIKVLTDPNDGSIHHYEVYFR